MVKRQEIEQTITKIIHQNKTSQKALNDKFGSNIRRTLKELTGENTKEYDILRDAMFDFYRKVRGIGEYAGEPSYDNEVMSGMSINGEKTNNFSNRSKDEINIPLKLEYNGYTEGLLYNIHFHPNDEVINEKLDINEKLKFTCFQSPDDVLSLLMTNTKYNITLGDDGFMIIVNENYDNKKNHLNPNDYKGTLEEKTRQMAKDRDEKEQDNDTFKYYVDLDSYFKDEFDDIIDEYDTNNAMDKLPIDSEEYLLLEDGFYNHYIANNIDDYVERANKIKGINVKYIPKT